MATGVYWLMLEGQNFGASIFDTQDLSTIRGGSLLMRDLVAKADEWLQRELKAGVRAATTGGSAGIWRIEWDATTVELVVANLRDHLDAGPARHLAYGTALVADDGQGYRRQRDRLRAILQRDRLASSRLRYPGPSAAPHRVCPVDFVRPVAVGTSQRRGPTEWVETSQAVYDRRRFGMEKKQTLIAEETENVGSDMSPEAAGMAAAQRRPFAIQITSISQGADSPDGLRANLHDKICVIALDGNGFGRLQDAALAKDDTPEGQRAFDTDLKGLRARLIAKVFSRLVELKGYGAPSAEEAAVREDLKDPIRANILRFELLLWGGGG